ncbi:hypothetical protein [Actinacidiphila oryziradicis]|uniref:Uncharacterized protein n=1 Tax=Actinacidiphila oryziradicis TaxID=2571141 RepID=A0A4U0SFN8_9ACTN|nr:hypothetical protein [Actinacidiphila oryziradicis]TKA08232.1 hypothetical protein FCI23_29640 [Actinacidiphila oryziradicis]
MSFPKDAGWRRAHHGTDLEVTSPCGRLTLLHQQEHTGSGPHLLVTARTGPDAPERWRITLRGHVPIEFVTVMALFEFLHLVLRGWPNLLN